MKKFYIFLVAIMFGLPMLKAQSSYLNPLGSYKASDLMASTSFSYFDIYENLIYATGDNLIYCFNFETNQLIQTFEKPAGYQAFSSFLTVSPDGSEVWAGFTTTGNTDDRIYTLDPETGSWALKAQLTANFDLEFIDGQILVSGLNSANWGDPNFIFLLDISGNNNHRKIIETGGNPAGFSVSANGNLYYGTSFFTQANALYRWDSGQLAEVIGNAGAGFLTLQDAEKLSDTPAGSYDCVADAEENIAFNFNDFSSDKIIAKWNGNVGNGFNFDTIAFASDGADWLSMIKVSGSFESHQFGNHLFVASFGRPLAEVHADYAPMIASQVPNFSGAVSDENFTYDLGPHFFDPDDSEEFTFEIAGNSNAAVAEVSIIENNLIIDFIAAGQTNISVWATSAGQSVIASFVVGAYPLIEGDFEEAGFDDLSLAPDSYWNGSDLSGGFVSGLVKFPNFYNESWASWSGWAYSNMTDDSTAGYLNQYSAITAEGFNAAASEGVNYGVGYIPIDFNSGDNIPVPVYFNDGISHEVKGFYATNSTYAAFTMEYGDDFTGKFGGESGSDPDYFMLSVAGYANGTETGQVDFYLADYRFEDNTQDYIIKTWQWVELSSLGEVDSLQFNLVSSDVGYYGMNTPGYVCIDQMYVLPESTSIAEGIANEPFNVSVYPNPVSDFMRINCESELQLEITILDSRGKILYEIPSHFSSDLIDVSYLSKGCYVVRIENGNLLATRRIIVL